MTKKEHQGSKLNDEKILTVEFAALLKVQPATVRRGLCLNGHYMGIIPTKLPNRRLLWPKQAALQILED